MNLDNAGDEGANICPYAECLSDLSLERHSRECRDHGEEGPDPDRAYDERGDR